MAILPLLALATLASANIHLDFTDSGDYSIRIDDKTWLHSASTRVHTANGWLSTGDGSLKVTATSTSTGSDSIGNYNCTTQGLNGSNTYIETVFCQYDDGHTVTFEQRYPNGIPKPSVNNSDAVVSAFPAFSLQEVDTHLGTVTWRGTFIDDSTHGPAYGAWPSTECLSAGKSGGPPMAWFAHDSNDVVVLSSMTNFMAVNMYTGDGALDLGILGSVHAIPAGYSMKFMLHHSNQGVNNAMTSWGASLLAYHGKTLEQRDNDQTLQYLGYNTDHGAYYYYNPEIGGDFNATLVAVYESAKELEIPYKFILLDSWWYYKGPHDGVKNWTAMPNIFPPGGNRGMEEFYSITQWPVIGHNRWWSPETTYSKENGGDYDFSPKDNAKMVVPLEQRFWDDLLSSSAPWGLKVYEQDWLYNEFEGVPMLTSNISMARTWLLQMGNSATKNNMTIQYCMPYPRHALQSVEIPAVTQIRASDDYVPNKDPAGPPQWHLGASSVFAHAVGLAPFKDNFWTTSSEGEHSSQPGDGDPAVQRESLVATLTTGPVTPGDGVAYQNKELIMRSCRNDGRLINPDRPAVVVDDYFRHKAFGDQGVDGEVWATYSTINGQRYDHVFSTTLQHDYELAFDSLTLDRDSVPSDPVLAYALHDTLNLTVDSLEIKTFNPSEALLLRKSEGLVDFELWHTTPVVNGVAVLGDLTKWIPMAATRVSQISADNDVTVLGSEGETVTVYFASVSGTGQDFTAQPGSCEIANGATSCVVKNPYN